MNVGRNESTELESILSSLQSNCVYIRRQKVGGQTQCKNNFSHLGIRQMYAYNKQIKDALTYQSHHCTTLAEFLQCYCGEIRQTLPFLINLYCPKSY
jgi:hypothetical protein